MDNSVKMEYLWGGDLIDKTKEAAKETGRLSTAAEQAAASITEKIAAQKAVVRQVEGDLKSLQKQYEKMAPGKAQFEVAADIKACKAALEEEKNTLTYLEAEHKKASTSVSRLTKEYRSLIQEMARMRLSGEQNTEQYQRMAKRAAELCDTLGDVRAQTKALASDDANWEAMASGLNGLSGAVTAGTGIMSLFVGENEELARVQTRLQSVMAITMGIQQVFNALNKDSAFRIKLVSKVTDMWTAANAHLATALGISTAAASALMATLTLGLSIAIGAAITMWYKHATAAKEAAAAQEKAAEEMREVSRSAAVQKAKLDLLYKATQDNTKSLKDRKAAVKNLQAAYPAYFGNMKTEAILAGQAASAYRQLAADIMKAAMARAYQERVEKLTKERVDLEDKKAANDKYINENKRTLKKADEDYKKKGSKDYNTEMIGGMTVGGGATRIGMGAGRTANDNLKKEVNKRLEDNKELVKQLAENQKQTEAYAQKALDNMPALNKVENKGYEEPKVKKEKQKKEKKNDLSSEKEELLELEKAAQKKIAETRVALMKEGYDKERAEALLQYEEEKQRIFEEETKRKELVKKLCKGGVAVSAEKEAQISTDAAKQRVQAAQMYSDKYAAIAEKEKKEYDDKVKEEKKKEEEALDALLSKHQDYNAQRMAVETNYTKELATLLARRNKDNANIIDAALVQLEKDKTQALKEIDNKELDEMKSSASIFVEMFENPAEKSVKQINKVIQKLADLKAYMDAMAKGELTADGAAVIKGRKGAKRTITQNDITKMGITPDQLKRLRQSPEALKAFMDQWQKLKQESLKKNPFKALTAAIKDLLDDKNKGDKSDKEKKIKRLAEASAEVAGEIGKIAGGLSKMFEEMGNDGMAEAMGTVEDVMNGVSNIAKGFASGGVVGGIIAAASEAINLIGKAFSAGARHQAALNAIMKERIAQQEAYNLLLMQQALLYEQGTTAFGTDRYGKATNAIHVMKQAAEEFEKAWKKANDIKVVTGHKKTGLFGWGKGKDTYSSLLAEYPKLIDQNGKFNVSLAESILKTRKMSDASKEALQHLIDLAKQQEEAFKEIRSYLTDIFGELGSNISNALVDAFRNGTDAGKAMVESVGRMLEKLGADMIYSAVLQKYFLQAQKDMEKYATDESISEEERFAAYARILDRLTANVSADSGKAASLLEYFTKKAKERGIDIFGGAAQQGRAGSIETMTQAQGTKLEGLMTSAQIHLASMDVKLEDAVKQMQASTRHLERIERYTAHCERLEDIANDINRLARDGIKVK